MNHLHPATGLPYFGFDADWKKVLPAEMAPSQRATTSSRTGSRVHRGTIWHAIRTASACPSCGRIKGDFPGAHAPHVSADAKGTIDCVGRLCTLGPDGYFHVAEVAP